MRATWTTLNSKSYWHFQEDISKVIMHLEVMTNIYKPLKPCLWLILIQLADLENIWSQVSPILIPLTDFRSDIYMFPSQSAIDSIQLEIYIASSQPNTVSQLYIQHFFSTVKRFQMSPFYYKYWNVIFTKQFNFK